MIGKPPTTPTRSSSAIFLLIASFIRKEEVPFTTFAMRTRSRTPKVKSRRCVRPSACRISPK